MIRPDAHRRRCLATRGDGGRGGDGLATESAPTRSQSVREGRGPTRYPSLGPWMGRAVPPGSRHRRRVPPSCGGWFGCRYCRPPAWRLAMRCASCKCDRIDSPLARTRPVVWATRGVRGRTRSHEPRSGCSSHVRPSTTTSAIVSHFLDATRACPCCSCCGPRRLAAFLRSFYLFKRLVGATLSSSLTSCAS